MKQYLKFTITGKQLITDDGQEAIENRMNVPSILAGNRDYIESEMHKTAIGGVVDDIRIEVINER